MTKALVVLSGGQDSTICLYWALSAFDEVECITFDYRQRHALEITAARAIASMAPGVKDHHVVNLGANLLRSASPLVNRTSTLETYNSFEDMETIIGDRIETTFVPMRNALFLTVAANYAVTCGAQTIITGVCLDDNRNYPDCTEAFISRMENLINVSIGVRTFGYMKISTPMMTRSKAESIRWALKFPGCYKALAYSHTAYDGIYPPTGKDHASVLRAHGFEQAGIPDPLVLRARMEELMVLPTTRNYQIASDQIDIYRQAILEGKYSREEIIEDMLDELEARWRATYVK